MLNEIKTKKDILDRIRYIKEEIDSRSEKDMTHSVAYYKTLFKLLDSFVEEINKAILLEDLPLAWSYEFMFDYEAISLLLVHRETGNDIDGTPYSVIDQSFNMISIPVPSLTTFEYSKIYGIEEITVRQWIRRGKIRTARKLGTDWLIPILTDIPKRGYTASSYDLPQLIKALPDDISYLQGYDSISIKQGKNKSEFIITLLKKDDSESEKEIVLNSKEKERLELYLIANPDVRYNMRFEESFIVDLMKLF